MNESLSTQTPPSESPQQEATATADATPQKRVGVTVEFSGQAEAYFKIWIVNLLLTIVTLGIYSAWAKVRTRQWFYANTKVNGHHFVYLATPVQILKGRIIAVSILAVFSAVVSGYGVGSLALWCLFVMVIPWLLVASLRFQTRMTTYRGIGFNFHGKMFDAYVAYLFKPILLVLTMGLATPWVLRHRMHYLCNNFSLGETRSTHASELRPYVHLTLLGAACCIAYPVLAGVVTALTRLDLKQATEVATGIGLILLLVIFCALTYLLVAVWQSGKINIYYNHTQLGPVEFQSSLQALPLAWLYLSNVVVVALSLGLLYPWAKVRIARYLAQSLHIIAPENDAWLLGLPGQKSSATVSELSDALDVSLL